MKALIYTIVLFFISHTSLAHDYWISPTEFRPNQGDVVPIKLFVGDHFQGQIERELSKEMTIDFELSNSKGRRDILDPDLYGKKPIGEPRFETVGTNILAIQRNWAHIEMEGPKFHDYLKHEGLTHIIDARVKAGEQQESATERYRRYLKSIVVVGDHEDEHWKTVLGHKLEIIPLSNPSCAKPGSTVAFRVLLDGKPLKQVQVAALGKANGRTVDKHGRTDTNGQVAFELEMAGFWMVRLVHLRRCEEDVADWESFWSSLTFEVKAD